LHHQASPSSMATSQPVLVVQQQIPQSSTTATTAAAMASSGTPTAAATAVEAAKAGSVGARSSIEMAAWLTSALKQGARGLPPPPSATSPTVQLVHPKSDRGKRIIRGILFASALYVGFNVEKAPYTNRLRLLAIPIREFAFFSINQERLKKFPSIIGATTHRKLLVN